MNKISINYRGFEIQYLEYDEKWNCILSSDRTINKEGLKDVKKRIDEFLKKENNFIRFNAIYVGRDNWGKNFTDKVTITSIGEDYFWVTFKDKREKISSYSSKDYVKDTVENIVKIEQVKSLKCEIDKLKDKIDSIYNTMEFAVVFPDASKA